MEIYFPYNVHELSCVINTLPEFCKCRVLGLLEVYSNSYIIRDVLDARYGVKIIFNETDIPPTLVTPEPVQIFGEVIHKLNKAEQDCYLRCVVLQKLQPTLLIPLLNIINDVKKLNLCGE